MDDPHDPHNIWDVNKHRRKRPDSRERYAFFFIVMVIIMLGVIMFAVIAAS